MTAPVLEASRDFNTAPTAPVTIPLVRPCAANDEGLQCGLGGTECPTDPAKVALCPSC